MSEAILEVEDVKVEFRVGPMMRKRVIHGVVGVSFNVRAGETFALVGESGSGKTTLARAVNGLQSLASGSVKFKGRQINGLGRREMKPIRSRMAMMFQDPIGSLSPRMIVGDLVTEPFRIHGIGGRNLKDETARLLSLVGLPVEFANRYPHQLSGGQARRVGIARALALEPSLVIADEPTAGLDVSVQGEVLNLLNELRQRLGLAMVFISHNLHVVNHIADRTAVMYLGRIVEMGNTALLFDAPAHPYTAALLAANPEPDPEKKRKRITLKSEVPSLLSRPTGCEFHTRCPSAGDKCRSVPPPLIKEKFRQLTCHSPLNIGNNSPFAELIQS